MTHCTRGTGNEVIVRATAVERNKVLTCASPPFPPAESVPSLYVLCKGCAEQRCAAPQRSARSFQAVASSEVVEAPTERTSVSHRSQHTSKIKQFMRQLIKQKKRIHLQTRASAKQPAAAEELRCEAHETR
jgi:hypothetical protein